MALRDGGAPADGASLRDAGAGDPCRSQCPLGTEDHCVEQAFESFPGLDVTLAEWSATKCTGNETAAFPYLLEARCADGKRLLYRGTGISIERRYYDASGTFLALETLGDGGQGPRCNGSAYWPVRIACEDAEATRVVCGTATFEVGDPVPL